jgi:energy-coupling factor transporter ATP-binding protein EcfA2
MPDDGLIEWANKQPDWVRDALRRHSACAGYQLSDEEKAQIEIAVRIVGGFSAAPAPSCSPLLPEHLNVKDAPGTRGVLCSLGPVKNLNRLAANQQLRFAIDGLTVIYGDNGSGKSGYCRIAKKLCRSLSADDLLGNVFESGVKPPAEVLVRYMTTGKEEPIEVTWTDGNTPPAAIASFTVFDSQNARLYVDRQNRIGFLPTEIALLERHGEHRRQLGETFDAEIKAIDRRLKTPLPSGYSIAGPIPEMLSRLDPKSKSPIVSEDELKKLAVISTEEERELVALELALANDPSTMAARARRVRTTLERYQSAAQVINERLSPEAALAYRTVWQGAVVAAEAASLAAADKFGGYPLPGVGLSLWRLLYEHAKAYALSLPGGSQEYLPDSEGERCVLCQQTLSAEAAGRIKEFNEFVAGAANKAADNAASARDEALRLFREMQIPAPSAISSELGDYGDLSIPRKETLAIITSFFEAAAKRRSALVEAGSVEAFASVPDLLETISPMLGGEIQALEKEALVHDKAATDDTTRSADRARRDRLRDQKKLCDDFMVVLARCKDLQERVKLRACSEAVETGSVSRQMTALRRSLVIKGLEKRILEEISNLSLTHIPFAVSDKSQDGQSYFEIGLIAPKAVANNKVLSEGEQRALALACFLAEVPSVPM